MEAKGSQLMEKPGERSTQKFLQKADLGGIILVGCSRTCEHLTASQPDDGPNEVYLLPMAQSGDTTFRFHKYQENHPYPCAIVTG